MADVKYIVAEVDGEEFVDYNERELVAADVTYDNSGSGLTANKVQGAIDELAASPAVYGSNRFYFSDESQSNTTSNGWVTKLNETTGALEAGLYHLRWQCEVGQSESEQRVGVRVRYRINTGGFVTVSDTRNGVSVENQYDTRVGFIDIPSVAEGDTINVDFDFGQTDDGGTGRIRNVRVVIYRIS